MSEEARKAARAVIEKRREERGKLIAHARSFVNDLERLDVVAAAVFGSVARGDFNRHSDVDVLIVARDLPDRWLERARLVADHPPRVSAIAWTPDELQARIERRDPIVTDLRRAGIFLEGEPWLQRKLAPR